MTLKAPLYTKDAKENGSLSLPEKVFGARWNPNLVHEVYTAMEANARTPLAHTKGRGDVSGGGKKPWRQKGTGRARHGSRRSPIWVKGGISHGPTNERDYSKKINKKAKHAALKSLLSKKLSDNLALFVDGVEFTGPKTKDAKSVLLTLSKIDGKKDLATRKRNAALIVTESGNETLEKSFRNIGSLDVVTADKLDVRDVLTYRHIVFLSPEKTVEALSNRLTK
jgi:large subunit ribosomal protein L4